MSYSFLFKYIIIGDSGTFELRKVSENLVFCSNTLIKDIETSMR